MNDLIPINYDKEIPTVSGRTLHKFLSVETPYTMWFSRMCEYGFTEEKDYLTNLLDRSDGLAGKPLTDHDMTIPMAKEISMIQRNNKGKQARQYFIAVEEAWNTPEMVMSRALKLADLKIKELQSDNSKLLGEVETMKPKADYFDDLVDRNLLTNFRDTAKELHMRESDFISYLIDKKYIYRDVKGDLKPYRDKAQKGLLEIKECVNPKTNWKGTQTLITPKGRETFRLLLRNEVLF